MRKHISILITVCMLFSLSTSAWADTRDTEFTDVDADAWYAEAVVYCRDNGLMSGTTPTTFSPNSLTSRAMLANILYRAEGSPTVAGISEFSDVSVGAWYSDAVVWATENNVIGGYGNGLFGTDDHVTREQFAAILWRNAGKPNVNSSSNNFEDEDSISDFAVIAVDWTQESGIVAGKENNRFDPKGVVTRAETAAMLQRYLSIETESSSETPVTHDSEQPVITTPEVAPNQAEDSITIPKEAENSMLNFTVAVGNRTFSAKIHDNESAQSLLERMPFTLNMEDYASQEKVASLPFALTSARTQTPSTINAGELYLWSGNNLVLFYTTFSNSYSYVPLGYIEDITGFREALGNGSVQVTFQK